MFGRFSTLWMNELLFANYLFRFKSLWLSKQISYNSSNNIWAFFVMKCIIYKQPSCILNLVLWQYVKFYAILPTLFHSQSLLPKNNCLTIAYLFEQNCPKNYQQEKYFSGFSKDLSKAFDTADNIILIEKFEIYCVNQRQ